MTQYLVTHFSPRSTNPHGWQRLQYVIQHIDESGKTLGYTRLLDTGDTLDLELVQWSEAEGNLVPTIETPEYDSSKCVWMDSSGDIYYADKNIPGRRLPSDWLASVPYDYLRPAKGIDLQSYRNVPTVLSEDYSIQTLANELRDLSRTVKDIYRAVRRRGSANPRSDGGRKGT